jgi:hypothetical protein
MQLESCELEKGEEESLHEATMFCRGGAFKR